MSGRLIVVGDPNQSLYRFRGADSHAFDRIKEMLSRSDRKLSVRSLPINYRCDNQIIQHSRTWTPELEGASKAEGLVDEITYGEALNRANNDGTDIALNEGIDNAERALPAKVGKHTSFAFLCRINLPLLVTAYQLIGQGKRVHIVGRDQIGAPLKQLMESLCGTNQSSEHYTNRITDRKDSQGRVVEDGLMTRLANYYRIQSAKLRLDGFEKKLESLEQNVQCVTIIAERIMDDKVSSIVEEINKLFSDEPKPGVISLSTVHRAKGLEWDVVFILKPDLMPHPNATSPDEMVQELNAQYVAATRARHRLYYVITWPFDRSGEKLPYSRPFSPYEAMSNDVANNEINRNVPVVKENEKFVDDGKPF